MEWLESTLPFFEPYSYLLPFLGGVFGGEETIILISMLAAQGFITFWNVFIFSFLGTILADSIWFFFGKTFLWEKIKKRKYFSKWFDKVAFIIDNTVRDYHFLALLFTKFLYGTRLITIMYLSREKMTFLKFSFYNAIVTFIWTAVIVPLGWFAGKGVTIIIEVLKNVQLAIIALIIFAIGFYLIRVWINKRLIGEQNQ